MTHRRFISDLASVEVSDHACNQYSRTSGDPRGNAIRRRNLALYLEALAPKIMLVGEAVSYRGGRLTGIPFTSETIMLSWDGGFRKATDRSRRSTEASATMVWAAIAGIDPLPLLWNAFPFHPFVAGNLFTNRLPTSAELAIGGPFIVRLMRLFAIEEVVAIGNAASVSLTRLGIPHDKIRHPSQGGKAKFMAGMARLSPSSGLRSAKRG